MVLGGVRWRGGGGGGRGDEGPVAAARVCVVCVCVLACVRGGLMGGVVYVVCG
jgi:hypothetical protein